jgi:hypothetical protein
MIGIGVPAASRPLRPSAHLIPTQDGSLERALKAFGKPACSSTPFAVCRLTIPTGTGNRRPVIGLCQISDCPCRPGGAAGVPQQSPQLAVEGRRHLRGGYHRHRLHPLRDNMQLDFVARRGEAVLGRDLRSNFEHS